jgi:outer membrane protein OmpA-like peptidoglycan-associated protein
MRLDDSWQHWSRPENLGASVNRAGRTTYYTEDARGEYAYVSWKASATDQSDIYRIKVSHPAAVALVHGHVTDANNKPLRARIRYERLSDGKQIGSAHSHPVSGEYEISLPAGEDYAVRADRDGYFPRSEHFDLRDLKTFRAIEQDLRLTKIETGTAITLQNVFFDKDKTDLLPTSFPELNRVYDLLVEHPNYHLEVRGHTDSLGIELHNQQLGLGRAEAVRNYLVSKGITGDRLTAHSFAASRPVATNATEEGRAQNRRVEFVLQEAPPVLRINR